MAVRIAAAMLSSCPVGVCYQVSLCAFVAAMAPKRATRAAEAGRRALVAQESWMVDVMLRMDWTTRHKYAKLVINSHTRRRQLTLIRMLEDNMCSVDLYFGQNDCRPPVADVIRLHDRPRGRQLT